MEDLSRVPSAEHTKESNRVYLGKYKRWIWGSIVVLCCLVLAAASIRAYVQPGHLSNSNINMHGKAESQAFVEQRRKSAFIAARPILGKSGFDARDRRHATDMKFLNGVDDTGLHAVQEDQAVEIAAKAVEIDARPSRRKELSKTKSPSFVKSIGNEDEFLAAKSESADGRLVVVKYFASWCRVCKRIEPKYKVLANELHDAVSFYQIDCATPNREFCKDLNVEKLPSVQLLRGDEILDTLAAGPSRFSDVKAQIEALAAPAAPRVQLAV
jgi:thioredoxin 1